MVDFADSRALAGARVAIAPVSQRDAVTTMVTAEDGRFSFPGLAPGKYTLTAQRRGYLTERFNQHDQFYSSIAAGPDADAADLIFRLSAESAIAGVVSDEHNEPAGNAQVLLFQSGLSGGSRRTRRRAATATDNEGFYRFAHLPAGRYFVAVSAQPWYAQNFTPRGATSSAIAWGSGATTFSGGMTGNSGISGISGSEDEPPSPLDVAYPLTFYPDVTDSSSAAAIVLERGEKNEIDIHLHPIPAVHFSVNTGTSDQPQQSWAILEEKVFDGVALPVSTKSMPSGPGTLEVTGVAPGHYSLKVTSGRGGVAEERDVDLSINGETDVRSGPRVPVTAILRFDPPATAGNLLLQIGAKNSEQVYTQRINGSGEAEFKPGLPPGSYEVSLQNSQGSFIRSMTGSGGRVTGRMLEIKSAGPVRLSLTVAQGQGEISGVALRHDKPVTGAMLLLVPADPAHNQVLFRRGQTDSDGSFTVAGVVPGRYTLLAIENGWDLEWTKPETLSKFMGQGEAVTVEMKGKHSVRVQVQ